MMSAIHHDGHARRSHTASLGPYLRLLTALALSYVVMFIVMYARVNEYDHVYLGLNQVYMAALMVAPMALIMLLTMPSMFGRPRLNWAIATVAVLAAVVALWSIRSQAAIDDRQMMRSMIPHHSGAILVCRNAALSDPRVSDLCREIIEAQEREIAQMKGLLEAASR